MTGSLVAGFGAALAATVLTTITSALLFGGSQLENVVMVYLLGIVLVSLRWGLWPSLLSAVLAIVSFDFFFIPPLHTFAVRDTRHIPTFAVIFIVAVVISGLTKRVRDQEIVRTRLAEQAQVRPLGELSDQPLDLIRGCAPRLRHARRLSGRRRRAEVRIQAAGRCGGQVGR